MTCRWKQLLNDEFRVQYFQDYIGAMADAYTLTVSMCEHTWLGVLWSMSIS